MTRSAVGRFVQVRAAESARADSADVLVPPPDSVGSMVDQVRSAQQHANDVRAARVSLYEKWRSATTFPLDHSPVLAARDQIEAALTVADQTALDELLVQTHGAVDPGAVWRPYLLLVLVQDHRPVDRDRLLFLLRWWWFDQLDREARARVARKWSRLRVAVPTEVVALARSASSTTTPPAPGERPALARLQELLAARHDLAAVHQEQREAAAIATERRRAVVAEVLAQADRATQIEDDETATEELFAKLRRDHENELVTGPATEDLGLVDLSARERLRALVPDGKGDRPVPLVAVDSELETAIRTAYLDALREARGGDLP